MPRKKVSAAPEKIPNLKKTEAKLPASKIVKKKALVSKKRKVRKPRAPRKNNKKKLPIEESQPKILLEKINIGNFSEQSSNAQNSSSNLLVSAATSRPYKRKAKSTVHNSGFTSTELPAKKQKQVFKQEASESIVEVTQYQIIQPKDEPSYQYDSEAYTNEQSNNETEREDLINPKPESLEDYSTDFSQEQDGDSIVEENTGVNKFENCTDSLTSVKQINGDYLDITIKQSPEMDIVEHLPNSNFLASDNTKSEYTAFNYENASEDNTKGEQTNVSQAQTQNPYSKLPLRKLLDIIKNALLEFKKEKALSKTASNQENQRLLIKGAVNKLQLAISELRLTISNPESSDPNIERSQEVLLSFERFLAKNNLSEYSDDESILREEKIEDNVSTQTKPVHSSPRKNNEDANIGNTNSSPDRCTSEVGPQFFNTQSDAQVDDTSSDKSFNTENSSNKSESSWSTVKSSIAKKVVKRTKKEELVKTPIVNVENILLNKSIVDKYNLRLKLSNVQNMISNNKNQVVNNTSDCGNKVSRFKSSTMESDRYKKTNITIAIPRITITQDLSKTSSRVVNMGPTKTISAPLLSPHSNFVNTDESFEEESYINEFDDECSLSACYWTECYDFSDYEKERIVSLDPIFSGATLMHEETIENIRQEINAFHCEDKTASENVQLNNINLKNDHVLSSVQRTEEDHFKIPDLVSPKRPPTRLRNSKIATSTTGSDLSNIKLTVQIENRLVDDSRSTSLTRDVLDNTKSQEMQSVLREDDAISLYADSSQIEILNAQDNQLPTKSSNMCPDLTTSNVTGNANGNSHAIAKLPIISTVDTSAKLSPKIVDPEKHLNVMQWITNTTKIATTAVHNSRIISNKSSTPLIFLKLCHFYYFKNCSRNYPCKSLHHVPPNIRKNIEKLQYDDLTSAYNYIRNSSKLYIETIDFFINGFINLKCDKQLIVMALDVLDLSIYNKTPIVKKFISALQKFNLTFVEAIGKIIDDGETRIALSDIILDIICAQSVPDIVGTWEIVQKLAKNRGQTLIDYGIVKDIMIKSYIERNPQLAKYIIDDIISPHIVELKAIQGDKIIKFSRFVSCQLPEDKYSLIDLFREYKVSIDFSKLTCSSLFKNSCKFHTPRVQFKRDDFEKSVGNPTSDLGLSSSSQDLQVENNIPNDDLNDEEVSVTNDPIKTIDLTMEESEVKIKVEPNVGADFNGSLGFNLNSQYHSGPEKDLKKLSDIINQGNALGFLAKLYDFQGTEHSRWFILNSICFFKLKPPPEICEMFITVLKGLEQFSNAMKESELGKMFRTLTLNMILVLAQEKAYDEAAHLLFKFYNELDTLIKVEWFLKSEDCDYSEAGKYLHFCKIFVRGGLLQEAVTLFRNSDLKLIYKSEMWPMKNDGSRDVEFRNRILKEILLKAIESNILIAKDLILFILMEKDHISELNIWKYFNQLIITMLENGDTYKEDLKLMIANILEGWYNNLSTLALRGLLVILLRDIPENVASKLYHKCSQKNIYPLIKGNETCLTLKTDMADEEIYMTLRVYFEKVSKRKYQLQEGKDLIIQIALPNTHNEKLHLVINNNSVSEFKARAYKILASCFNRAIHIENTGCEPRICIKSYQLQLLFTKISLAN